MAMMTALIPLPAMAKPAGRMAEVVVDKLAFGVISPKLRVGDTIVWINRDIFRHSATAPGHFDVDLPPGARVRMVLRRAGAFGFVCKYHPGMKGVVKVSR
jgi:plastocyanin